MTSKRPPQRCTADEGLPITLARGKTDMAERTCDEPGCSRPHRAKGLCALHWRRKYEKRTTYDIICATCQRPHRTKRPDGKYCSVTCSAVAQRKPQEPRVYVFESPQQLLSRRCATCYRTFGATWPANFCRADCEADAYRFRTSARWISNDERVRIYERDEWTCGICGSDVCKDWDPVEWLGPSLDHIVPRSQGGSDDAANLRLVHFICNSIRGAGGGGEQLALIG